MAEAATQPSVSLLELRLLFEDHPTPALVVAMCEQATCVKSDLDLIRAMYRVPDGRDPRAWLEEALSYEHRMLVDVGVNRWLVNPKEAA